jgi:hypothetical protein
MSKMVTTETNVVLDYPKPGEVITSAQYSLRVGATEHVQNVEVSIDGSPWLPTRQAAGFYWFDWSNYMSGRHEIAVRARLFDGNFEKTDLRRVRVELEPRRF